MSVRWQMLRFRDRKSSACSFLARFVYKLANLIQGAQCCTLVNKLWRSSLWQSVGVCNHRLVY